MTPSTLGYSADIASKVFGWPGSLLVGDAPKVPIWTTKYILAMNYTSHTDRSREIYREVQLVHSQQKWHTVAKVLSAATVVLPLLNLASWFFAFLASLDPAIAQRLENKRRAQEEKQKLEAKSALAASIRDFAGLLLTVSAKARTNAITITRTPDQQLERFKAHFSKIKPQDAISACCKANIDLLKACYTVDLTQKDELKTKTVRAYEKILTSTHKQEPLDWMKGAATSPLYPEWLFLTTNREAFFKVID